MSQTGRVVDFNEIRNQKLDEKRRTTERIFFKNMLGVYTITGGSEMRQVEIIDVSEEGLAFQVPFDTKSPWPEDVAEVPVRLYFTQDTYLEIQLLIQNSRAYLDHGVKFVRYGCKVDRSLRSYEAFKFFVKFLRVYAENSHKDTDKMTVFYL